MADVAMPRLSDSMEEGTILKWLKSDGDEVKRGEELVEIETDKANMTYEADSDGTLTIVAKEGDTLPVGETIARLGDGSEDSGGDEEEEPEATSDEDTGEDEARRGPPPRTSRRRTRPTPPGTASARRRPSRPPRRPRRLRPATAAATASRPRPSPSGWRARWASSWVGSRAQGPAARIVKADVEAAAKGGTATAEAEAPPKDEAPPQQEAPAAAGEAGDERSEAAEEAPKQDVPAPVVSGDKQTGRGETTEQDLTRLQKTVARRMAESKATAPDFVLTVEVDMEEAVALRKQLKAAAGDQPAPSFNDFVIKASALALRDFPRANGAYRDGKFELYGRVNVGVAVAGQDALVVPTVFDADSKSLGHIARESRALAERVRAGAITPPELSSGTFTVSNLGMYGIKRFVAVINPPQAAILAVGALEPRPVVRDRKVEVRSMMELTLSCDHRILYGADAAEFLAKIREYLENPLRLAL